MKKVILEKINLNWTPKELVNKIKSYKKVNPGCFIDGTRMSIVVIK